MKHIVLTFIFFQTVLLCAASPSLRRELCFEENAGRVNGQDHLIRYFLRSALVDYYFWDGGYSVVRKAENGSLTRVDYSFQEKQVPAALDFIGTQHFYYGNSAQTRFRKFNKISYTSTGFTWEFFVEHDSLIKKLTIFGQHESSVFPVIITAKAGEIQLNIHYKEDNVPETLRYANVTAASSVLEWITYLGGNSSDELFGIALTNDSGVVVTGRTSSANFPVTPGAYQDTFGLNYDAVITRFDKDGNCLWSTFYGGTNFDGAYQAITLDSVFVIAGMSSSTDLPMMNATQISNGGSYDAFLLMLNDSGQLVRSTYYGGGGSDQGLSIAKGNAGEIVLAGSSTSTNLPFTSTGYQATMAGMIDAFIAVLDDSFNIQWSSYYGGASVEDIHTVTVTPLNEIAFAGATRSFDFPVTANAYQSGLLNQPDNYIVKFSITGARLYATFFGGTNTEDANAIVGDEEGNLYLTGYTYSADFPTQGTVFQPAILGQSDVYVSRFDSTGQLVWSTFVGGGGQDIAWGMYRLGKYLFICGQTESATFPVSANAIQAVYAANTDGFVIKMDTAGQMISGTFMGGNGVDALLAMVVDADTNVFACGNTYSTNLPLTSNPFQATNAGSGDGYVVKFGMSEELISTAVAPTNKNATLLLYPNPAEDFLMINLIDGNSITQIEIFDASGRVVKRLNVGNVSSIYTGDLESGIYFIKILDGSAHTHTLRFIKK
ncbi:MAG: T9SS type A sorting domain-containing protein [Bacteroidota bacterium]|nr:T9SS type A sorting domain-containing protein [Bacteroidota bacterium]